METKDHVQPEGFCLMNYRCKNGHNEVIWNSRPHVTPMFITCKCGAESSHINWRLDKYAPTHKPSPGDRIFVDLTAELAHPLAVDYVEKYWDNPQYPMSQMYESKEKAAASFVKSWVEDCDGHGPHVLTVI